MEENTQSQKYKIPIKLTIFGTHNVGKTSIIVRFIESRFLESYYPTIRENHFITDVVIEETNLDHSVANSTLRKHQVNLEIIDTMGQDSREQSDLKVGYVKSLRNIDGLILCYNVADAKSFDVLRSMRDKLVNQFQFEFGKSSNDPQQHEEDSTIGAPPVQDKDHTTADADVSRRSPPGIPLLLIGNKSDLPGRQVSEKAGRALAKEWDTLFFECSARDGNNVNEALETFVRCVERHSRGSFPGPEENRCSLM